MNSKNYSVWMLLPPSARYNSKLSGKAILLFGEVAALSHQKGYCFATNQYFAGLFNTTDRTIRNWLNALKKEDLINIKILRNSEGTERRIYLSKSVKSLLDRGGNSEVGRGGNKMQGGEEKKCHHTTIPTPKRKKSLKIKKTNSVSSGKKKLRQKESSKQQTRRGDVSQYYPTSKS